MHPWAAVPGGNRYGLYVPHEFANNLIWAQALGVISKRKWLSSWCKLIATRTRFIIAIANFAYVYIDLKRVEKAIGAAAAAAAPADDGGDDSSVGVNGGQVGASASLRSRSGARSGSSSSDQDSRRSSTRKGGGRGVVEDTAVTPAQTCSGSREKRGQMEAKLRANRFKLMCAMVKIFSDLGLNVEKSDALHALTGSRLSEGVQGLCGVVGSVAGMIPLFADAASKVK